MNSVQNQLQLKKLICTSYAGSKIDQIHDDGQLQMTLLDDNGEPVLVGQGYVLVVSKVPGKTGEEVSNDIISESNSNFMFYEPEQEENEVNKIDLGYLDSLNELNFDFDKTFMMNFEK